MPIGSDLSNSVASPFSDKHVPTYVHGNTCGHVELARRRELSWDKLGAALGMKRRSAWERFAG